MMSTDDDIVEDFLNMVEDKYTGEELVEMLGLTARDIIEMFRDEILNKIPSFIV